MGWTLADSLESNVIVLRNSVVIATLPAGTTSYSDNSVSPSTTYSYVIRA